MVNLVDGNAISREVRAEVAASLAALASNRRHPPAVAIVQVGDDPSADIYTRRLQRTFAEAGVVVGVHRLEAAASVAEVTGLLCRLGQSPEVHGIQLQTPLPPQLVWAEVVAALDPRKDLDGIHPHNAGLLAQGRAGIAPATPLGGIEILMRHEVPISGARAVVVGRSASVGRPMAFMLLSCDATVTVCHSRTVDLGLVTREAEILAVAAGRPSLITADMVRPGAVVIDFGVNVVDGKIVGDVDPLAADCAALFTPVPGGTGPVTTAMLLRNTLTLYQSAEGVPP